MADLSLTANSVVPSNLAQYLSGDVFAGENLTAGQIVYDASAQVSTTVSGRTVKKADAANNPKAIGIVVNTAGQGQPCKVLIVDPGLALGLGAAGDVFYLSATPGGLTSTYADLTTGKTVVILGIGIGNNKINFAIINAGVPK